MEQKKKKKKKKKKNTSYQPWNPGFATYGTQSKAFFLPPTAHSPGWSVNFTK